MDDDLERLTRDELIAEVKQLRTGIREHRDSSRHDLCWHHPELWGLLPEKIDPNLAVPAWPQFLRGCLRYRESLDAQLPNAPRVSNEFEESSRREAEFVLHVIGVVQSPLKKRGDAPKMGNEGAPEAWLDLTPIVGGGLQGLAVTQEIIVITWFHQARRDVLKLHPRWDKNIPLTGVFNTRSPDRPNPLGLHRVKILEIAGNRLKVGPLEAIDGTPVVDIKPALSLPPDS